MNAALCKGVFFIDYQIYICVLHIAARESDVYREGEIDKEMEKYKNM